MGELARKLSVNLATFSRLSLSLSEATLSFKVEFHLFLSFACAIAPSVQLDPNGANNDDSHDAE